MDQRYGAGVLARHRRYRTCPAPEHAAMVAWTWWLSEAESVALVQEGS